MITKREMLGFSLVALFAGSPALANTPFTTFAFPSTGGSSNRTDPARWADFTNAMDFGATGNGSTDDTAAIQAAIDAAYAAKKHGVRLPAGIYKISSPLFLDAPGNLRSSLTTPTIFGFSLSMIGDEGDGNNNDFGTQLKPTTDNFVALWVGPGQGMAVKNISIIYPVNSFRNTMSTSGCGIAIAGGAAGASRTLISECMVANCYQGISTGFNGNGALGDSTSVVKCYISNCYIGYNVIQAQNYINSLIDCSFDSCTTAVSNTHGPQVIVRGGNYSCASAAHKIFAIGTVSAFTTFSDIFAGSSVTNCRFTAVVSSPDTAMNNATYDCAAIKLTGFGAVPCRLESFNTGTNTATFSLWPQWIMANFGYILNLSTGTDLHTEIAAATTIYACENITMFSGSKIYAQGVHVENPNSLTRLVSSTGIVKIEDFYFNYDIAHGDDAGSGTDTLALFICQQCFPFILQNQGRITFNDNNFSQLTNEGIVIDIGAMAVSQFNRNDGLSPPIVRYCSATSDNIVGDTGNDPYSAIRGAIEFDTNPFVPTGFTGNNLVAWHNLQERISGRRPVPASARLTPTQVTAYGSLGSPATYPPLCGDTVYSVSDFAAATTHFFLKSGAPYYSYGQNLTTSNVSGLSWSYKGQTSIVTMDANTLKLMFPGLKIILNNGSNQSIMVTGVHPSLGYIDAAFINTAAVALPGTKTSTFTGTLITQDAYAIVQSP